MLNIGKLRKGGELYYLNSVAKGVEDYYLGSGEAPGYWLAGGSKDLGLEGEVGQKELRAVLNGFHPADGGRLTALKQTRRGRVPGFDLTFRAPKSVSLLHALGDKEASNEVVSAHDTAVAAALAYLERHGSHARRGAGGKNKIASKGFIGAAFRHRTSRAGDPLLHTHVLVANLIKGEDGRWGALDARQLYIHAKTAGYLYQAQLRMELTRRLGVQWTPVRNGAADIDGIPRQVIRAFSRRRSEIEALVGDTKDASAKAAELAAVTTRKAKDYRVSPSHLLAEWRRRAERLGLDNEALRGLLGRTAYRAPTAAERGRIEAELAGPTGLTVQASTFSRREAIQGFCERLQGGAQVSRIERLADGFLSSESVIPLSARDDGLTAKDSIRVSDGRIVPAGIDERRYSTADMLGVEQTVVERAIERRLERCAVVPSDQVSAALAQRPSLGADQVAMVRRVTTSGLGVEVVVGKAGSGKTFALDAARDAWTGSGHRVIGCALSARAAEELQWGSGIDSYTIAGLLQDIEHPVFGGLAANSVVVVDEAGMVGTRTLDRLLAHAENAGAKVVLVGDDRQLPEIEAGGAFRGIKNRLPAIELNEIRRQPFGWERDALELIREGRAREALDAYTAHGRVVVGASAEETRRHLLSDWWDRQSGGEPAVMIAARRSEVDDLNDRARALMVAAGKLDKKGLIVAGRCFATGDRVMTLKNTRIGVKNGTRGVVQSLDAHRGEVTICTDKGLVVTLPRSYLDAGHLTHAYALTGHKAQGMTTDKTLVLADETVYREWVYATMSRGKNDNRLYVVAGVDPDREELGGEVTTSADPMKELVRAVGRSRAKDLALDAYEHEETRNLSMGKLRQEWQKERRVIERLPADVTGELAQLRSERAELEEIVARQRNIRRDLQRQLKAMGPIGRRRGRTKAAALNRRISEAREGEGRVAVAVDQVRQRELDAEARAAARDRWLVEHAPAIKRLDALGRELWWREQQQAIAAEVSMPQYVVRAVGERPLRPSERAGWHEAVRAVESYRERWGVTDARRPLGEGAEKGAQHAERDEAQQRIDAVRERSHEREVEVRERSLEI